MAAVPPDTAPAGDGEPPRRPRVRPGNPLFTFDLRLCYAGKVAGADEAGRGSLAGPLVAAAVCFDYARLTREDYKVLTNLNDSKKLTRPEREVLYPEILRRAHQVAVVCCSQKTIDREGLHRCNLASLAKALAAMVPEPDLVLVDGFSLPAAPSYQPLIRGDARSAAIAAASIVAKVTRDRLMIRLHEQYPEYGFDRHVGYRTPRHRDAIISHGVCELHRLSFSSSAYGQLELTLEDAQA